MASYSDRFFDLHDSGSRASAARILPLVLDRARFESAVDVGCGTGAWARVLLDHGLDVTGIDGDYVNRDRLLIPSERFRALNLSSSATFSSPLAPVDLAVSMEVAEHLPESVADALIGWLTDAAPVVLFSAAVPRQGGTLHVNEQWQGYWLERFAARGFGAYDVVRPAVWSDRSVDAWYAQNALLYVKHDQVARLQLSDAERPTLIDVVHPRLHLYLSDEPPLARVAAQLPSAIRRTARYRHWTLKAAGLARGVRLKLRHR